MVKTKQETIQWLNAKLVDINKDKMIIENAIFHLKEREYIKDVEEVNKIEGKK